MRVPQVFCLQRIEDETGVSGTGVVAWGIVFLDGRVAMRWCAGQVCSTSTFDSIDDVEAIHGHAGKTVVVFLQDTHPARISPELEQALGLGFTEGRDATRFDVV